MVDSSAMAEQEVRFAEALPVAGLLLGGVPALTILLMAAASYVANGSL